MKVNFVLPDHEIDEIVECKDLAIEQLLFRLKRHIESNQGVTSHQKSNQLNAKSVVDVKQNKLAKKDEDKIPSSGRQEQLIKDLTETVSVLEQKLDKMIEMMVVKDKKIKHLTEQLEKFDRR